MLIVAVAAGAMNIACDLDIPASGQCRQEIELLKHKADLLTPNSGKSVVVHSCYFVTIDEDLARARFRHSAQNVHQRGFAAA